LDSTVQLDKKEWEAFLEKLSELEKKYQLVLHELDEAHGKLQALDNPRDEQDKKPEKTESPTAPSQEETKRKTTEPKKLSFLAALENKLRSRRIPPSGRNLMGAQPNHAFCSRCRNQVMHATRFCDHCGADFGGWICSCGRGLLESVRYCDRCGRKVEDAILGTGG